MRKKDKVITIFLYKPLSTLSLYYSKPHWDIPSYKKSTVLLTNLLIPNFLGFRKLANKTTETITRPILDVKAKSTKPRKMSTLKTSFMF